MKRLLFSLMLIMPTVAIAKDNISLSLDASWKDVDKNTSGYAHFTFIGRKTGNDIECYYEETSLGERQENGAKLYSLGSKSDDTKTCNSQLTSCQCKISDNQIVFSNSSSLPIDKGNPFQHNCRFEISFMKNETPMAKYLPNGSLTITDFSGVCTDYGDSAKSLIQYRLIKEKEQITLDGKMMLGGNYDLESVRSKDVGKSESNK